MSSSFQNAIDGLGNFLINGIRDIFVPSEDFLTEKVNAIRERFSIADFVITLADYFDKKINAIGSVSVPPSLTVNFASSNSVYDWGGEAVVLDLSWYEPYKPTVDSLLSGILWVVFAWRLIVAAPGIINGVPGSFEMGQDLYYGDTYAGMDRSGKKVFKSIRGGKKR